MSGPPGGVGAETWFLLAATLLCTASLSVLAHPAYWMRPGIVAPAVLVDLSLGLPLLGYLLLVRRGRLGRRYLLLFLAAGAGLAAWWIPSAHLDLGRAARLALPLVEVGLLAVLVLRLRRFVIRYRVERGRDGGKADAVREGLREVLGERPGEAVFTEVAVLAYAFGGWWRSAPDAGDGTAFSLHRRDAYGALLGAILMAVAVEMFAVHLLLGLWSPLAAWIATGLTLYSALWLVGDFQAARLEPFRITDDGLRMRVGLRWRVRVAWDEVVALHEAEPDGASVSLALLGRPDFWIETREPVRVEGPLGIRRQVRFLGVRVDDHRGLARAVRNRLDAEADSG